MRILVILAVFGLGPGFLGRVLGQSSFWDGRNAFLGQRLVGDTPRIFAPGLLASKDTFSLDRVAFSDDGREFYCPTNNTWFSGVNGDVLDGWADAVRGRRAAGYGVFEYLPDGPEGGWGMDGADGISALMIFVRCGCRRETPTFECELDISFHKPDGSWTAPMSLGPLINDGVAHRWGEYVSPDGRYLFYSRGTSPKDCHVYWVRWDRLLERLRGESK